MTSILRHIEARTLPSQLKHGLSLHHTRLEGTRLLPVVRCSTGEVHGFGEAPPLPTFTHETAEDTVHNISQLTSTLLGRPLEEAQRLLHSTDISTSPQTRAAIDIALCDLTARLQEKPVHQLLGTAVAARIRISRAIGLHSPQRTVELAREYVDAGVTALKLKVGRDTQTDAEVIKAVRDAFGLDLELAIDANEGFTRDGACALVNAVRDCHLAYFEQPVPRDDLAGLRAVRETGIKVLADESLFTAEDAVRLLAEEAADLFAIKLIKCGGLTPALEILRVAEEQSIPVIVIDPLGSAISLNAGLHLAAIIQDHPYAHGLSAALDVTASHAPHLPIHHGFVQLPSVPGLGTDVVWSPASQEWHA